MIYDVDMKQIWSESSFYGLANSTGYKKFFTIDTICFGHASSIHCIDLFLRHNPYHDS